MFVKMLLHLASDLRLEPPEDSVIRPTGPAHYRRWDHQVTFGAKTFRGSKETGQILSREEIPAEDLIFLVSRGKKNEMKEMAHRAAFRDALLVNISFPDAQPPASAEHVADYAKRVAKHFAKNVLQNDCVRMLKNRQPVYDSVQEGPSHDPTFTTTVTLPDDWGSFTGLTCSMKVDAEQSAAFEAWWNVFVVGPHVQGGEPGTAVADVAGDAAEAEGFKGKRRAAAETDDDEENEGAEAAAAAGGGRDEQFGSSPEVFDRDVGSVGEQQRGKGKSGKESRDKKRMRFFNC